MYDPLYNANDPTGPRKSKFWSLRHTAGWTPRAWQWPIETLGTREPIVLAETPELRLDVGYEARPYDTQLFAPVFAAQDGVVMFCGEAREGFAVSINHDDQRWASCYSHLSKVFLDINRHEKSKRRQRVRAGEVIGYAAKSPIHVRFQLNRWTDDRGFVAVDPITKLGPLNPIDAAKAA